MIKFRELRQNWINRCSTLLLGVSKREEEISLRTAINMQPPRLQKLVRGHIEKYYN